MTEHDMWLEPDDDLLDTDDFGEYNDDVDWEEDNTPSPEEIWVIWKDFEPDYEGTTRYHY